MTNLNLSNHQDLENADINLRSKDSILQNKEKAKQEKIHQSLIMARKRVDEAMYANQSMLVYELRKEHFEDFEYNVKINLDAILDYGYNDQVIEHLKEKRLIDYKLTTLNDEIFDDYEEIIMDFITSETDLRYEMEEYYEAWLVDGWLLHQLENKGQLIIDYNGYEQWWGRGCTGQHYQLDFVIMEITKELAATYAGVFFYEVEEYLKIKNTTTFNLY